jgi:DNA repair photolyase
VGHGCLFGCLWCPLKPHEPGQAALELYSDLPEKLERELGVRERAGMLPREILLNLTTDSFQPVPALLTLTHDCLRILLEAGCHVSLRTRGVVPEGFGELFSRHARQLSVEIVLFTLDQELLALYEPGAPSPRERLDTIRRLNAWGLSAQARIEPLMPFVSDTVGHLEELLSHLRSAGATRTAVSYLVLTPPILERLEAGLPAAHRHLIKGSFRGQAWRKSGLSPTEKVLPERLRREGYQRLQHLARKTGLEVRVCGCSNPGLGETCQPPVPVEAPDREDPGGTMGQLDLFSAG